MIKEELLARLRIIMSAEESISVYLEHILAVVERIGADRKTVQALQQGLEKLSEEQNHSLKALDPLENAIDKEFRRDW